MLQKPLLEPVRFLFIILFFRARFATSRSTSVLYLCSCVANRERSIKVGADALVSPRAKRVQRSKPATRPNAHFRVTRCPWFKSMCPHKGSRTSAYRSILVATQVFAKFPSDGRTNATAQIQVQKFWLNPDSNKTEIKHELTIAATGAHIVR